MQTKINITSAKTLLLVTLCVGLVSQLAAQNQLFSTGSWSTQTLTTPQLVRYNKILTTTAANEIHPVVINNLAQSQTGGRVLVNIPDTTCGTLTFRVKHSEYFSESDYVWYAEIEADDSVSCSNGLLLLQSKNGEKFGELKVEHAYYSIEDLGGVHALVSQPTDTINPKPCGGALTPDSLIGGNEVQPRTNGNCDVRILVLFTPRANAAINNIQNLATSSVNVTNQAFRNSAVTANDLNLVIAGIEEFNFDESQRTFEQAINTVSSFPFINQLNQRRDATDADIVMMLVDNRVMTADGVAGIAFLGPNPGAFIGLCRSFGSNNGFVFSHEVGHLFGGNHEPCTAEDAGNNCVGNTAGGFQFAHTWSYKKGVWPFRKDVKRKTIMYSAGGNNSELIQHFSNPNVKVDKRATGINNERDNSRFLSDNACLVANYLTEEALFTVRTTGSRFVCQTGAELIGLHLLNAPPGPYQYLWEISVDGISWSFLSNGTSTMVSGSNYNVGDILLLRVTVTAGNGQTSRWWHYLEVVDRGYEGLLCARSLPSIDYGTLSIYPNPSSDDVQLNFALQAPSNVLIQVSDLSGKLWHYRNSNYPSGDFNYTIQTVDMPNGMYVLQFSDGKRFITSKLLKQ